MKSEITIHSLTPARLQDYMRFFDFEAFADNPHWASCYCHFNQAPHHLKKWEERDAQENRAGATGLIERGELHGYLAYRNDAVVGWCNANARMRYTTFDPEDIPEGDSTAAIVCFVVAPQYRKLGIARELLDAALEGLEKDGMQEVYAITRRESSDDAENHHGPLKMYLDAGFEIVEERPPFVRVGKQLGSQTGRGESV